MNDIAAEESDLLKGKRGMGPWQKEGKNAINDTK